MLYRNRYYAPILGRFITRDPNGYEGRDINLYRYISNTTIIGLDTYGLEYCNGICYNPKTHCCIKEQIKVNYLLCVRCSSSHAWIYAKNLDTGMENTYGRWKNGYGSAKTSGVHSNIELGYTFQAERCQVVCDYTPTLGSGYGIYGNNCSSYAQEEWQKNTNEILNSSSWWFGADRPGTLCKSIRNANGGRISNWDSHSNTGSKVGGISSSGNTKHVPDDLGNFMGSSVPNSMSSSTKSIYPLSPEESCGCISGSFCGLPSSSSSSCPNSSGSSGWYW